MTKKTSLSGLLLAGAAAYGIYKLSKLSSEERSDLLNKGKKLVSDNIPKLKNVLRGNGSANMSNTRANNFSEEVTYGG
jgi:hypothetical protein